ncbi:MAG: PQQ-like beta-propeller repeat protein [Asgard group archaeon]|nr:PQQ-like beta-propeller repeat protein [Asgard group archaeon]
MVKKVDLERKALRKVKRKRRRRLTGLTFLLIAEITSVILMGLYVPFGKYDLSPDVDLTSETTTYAYYAPLDSESPWPKFRGNVLGNGRSTVDPIVDPLATPWSFQTGKGIFSSPVIDAEGTVYLGSADQIFYALYKNCTVKWTIETDEIIDSSALLDDEGRVIFGSGDTHVYCVDKDTGAILWKFKAHTVEEAEEEFGLELNNVNWFEGNIAMLPDGTILAPNDNQILYALNRTTGERQQVYFGNEMIWSLPAVNPITNRLFFGTTNFALKTLFCYDSLTSKKLWTTGGLGSIAASPLLTSTKINGAVIVGSYDGILRAYTQRNGKLLWKVGMYDHIYSSPGQLSDGTIIQPSADGTVYAINHENGQILWKFDTFEPIRSSPAIDGNDVIYVGSGEGKLFAINPDGTLRWAYQLITQERNDLNGSPGLGKEGIYIAGESGEIFYVPYDYPLTPTGQADPRTTLGPNEALPDNGVFLLYSAPFGALYHTSPTTIYRNQPITLSLFVRKDGDNVLTEIDKDSLHVEVSGKANHSDFVAGNRRFLTIVPQETWCNATENSITINVTGKYRSDMSRIGLKFFWGKITGDLDTTFTFQVKDLPLSLNPFQAPNTHAGNSSVFEFIRPAVPFPSMLPSYNQIGFDSLHYIGGVVEASGNTMLLWVIPGKYSENGTSINPELRERYPIILEYDNGLLTFRNYDGFKINFIGAWDMPFNFYRISTIYNQTDESFVNPSPLIGVVNADEIAFYGTGLKLMGMSDFKTGEMLVSGGILVNKFEDGLADIPTGIGIPDFTYSSTNVQVILEGSSLKYGEHVYSLLLVDAQGNPLPLYYSANTKINYDEYNTITGVSLTFKDELVKGDIKVYFMVDTYPIISQILTIN